MEVLNPDALSHCPGILCVSTPNLRGKIYGFQEYLDIFKR